MDFADKYVETKGMCRNENGDSGDIFINRTTPTLKECKKMCDNKTGCTAVSYQEAHSNCHGTSMKATTNRLDSDWMCYYKPGYEPLICSIDSNLECFHTILSLRC